MDKYIRYAAYAGIASIILSLLAAVTSPNILIALSSLAAAVATYGFYRIGVREKLKLLKAISLILIALSLIYSVLYLYSPAYVLSVENLIFVGAVTIIFSYSLLPLKKKFKNLVKAVIILGFASGALMTIGWLSVSVLVIGSFLAIIFAILETIFLYKASSKYK